MTEWLCMTFTKHFVLLLLLTGAIQILVSVVTRFLSIPKGFSYLSERGYITKQMEKWQKVHINQRASTILFFTLDINVPVCPCRSIT